MSKFKRDDLKKMILSEMRMMGMADMDMLNMPRHSSHGHDASQMMPSVGGGRGSVSREDCCEAIRCLVECCSCPVTRAAIIECCDEILAGDYDE